jgi:hypothetical protein
MSGCFGEENNLGSLPGPSPNFSFFPVYLVTVSIKPSRFHQIPLTLLLYLGKCSDYVVSCWTIEFRSPVLIILSRTAFTDGVHRRRVTNTDVWPVGSEGPGFGRKEVGA